MQIITNINNSLYWNNVSYEDTKNYNSNACLLTKSGQFYKVTEDWLLKCFKKRFVAANALLDFMLLLLLLFIVYSMHSVAVLQFPLKVLEPHGQFLCFYCSLKTFGFKIKRWIWDKSSELQLLFPGIYISMCETSPYQRFYTPISRMFQ